MKFTFEIDDETMTPAKVRAMLMRGFFAIKMEQIEESKQESMLVFHVKESTKVFFRRCF